MQCCLAGLPGLVRGARDRQLPHGVTLPAGMRSLSQCLCHVPGMPLHVSRAARHRVADAIAMGQLPGVHGRWDSRIGTDLTRGPLLLVSKILPIPFQFILGAFFSFQLLKWYVFHPSQWCQSNGKLADPELFWHLLQSICATLCAHLMVSSFLFLLRVSLC